MDIGCNLVGIANCYLRGGFSVIPVHPNSKTPKISWSKYKIEHMSQNSIRNFFGEEDNIAVITGAISQITVIDIDDENKFSKFYNFNGLIEKANTIVKSPKGYHFWFKYDSQLETSQIRDFGFDIKNDNAIINVPPSRIDGRRYLFLKSDGIGEIPLDFKEKILKRKKNSPLMSNETLLEEVLNRVIVTRQLSNGDYRCVCPAHEDDEPSLDVGFRNGKLYIKCWAGCSKDEVLKAIGIEEPKNNKENNTTKKILQLFESSELWINQNKEEFITLNLNGSIKHIRLDSKEFRKQLQYLFFQRYSKPAHTQAVLEAVQTLSGKALLEGKKYTSFVRIGKGDDLIELDLLNGYAVQIRRDSIIIDKPICKFEQSSNLKPLPFPDLNVGVNEWEFLSTLLNTSKEGIILSLAWLIGCFNIDGEFPVLNIVGEREGVGKSTASKFLKSVIDPANVAIKPLPKVEDDLLVVCLQNHIIAFDNISHITDSLSDALCRISTGSGIAKRKLFTDTDAVLYFVKKPLIINGIDLFAERRDLRRRCIHVELERLSNPRPINQLERVFNEAHPRLLGWLLKAVQLALREDFREDFNLTDMASFVEFVCKAEKIFPIPSVNFVETFKNNRLETSLKVVSENPITTVILELTEAGEWRGTVSELHEKISQRFLNTSIGRNLPKDPKSLSRKIRRMISDLENLGVFCEFFRDSRNLSNVHIKREKGNISDISVTPKPLKINGSHYGDISEMTEIKENISEISPVCKGLKNETFGDNGDMEIRNQNFFKCDVIDGKDINPDDIVIEE